MANQQSDPPPTAAERALSARVDQLAQRRAAPSAASDRRSARSRRHPAARARAAAIGISLASTAGLTAFFTSTGSSSAGQLAGANVIAAPATPSTLGTGVLPATSAPVRANAVVDGGVFQNRWGDVQIEATFAPNGALVSVTALRTPNDRDKSIRINDAAVPRLNAEAVSAQSAAIDTVSGATYTSADYRRSLQSAIDAARAAHVTRLA
ncbi:MAG: hypothetical protein QOK28_752 [Actinomycetota bacterium]|jgi:uncharacterized protein with FMN-binding domain